MGFGGFCVIFVVFVNFVHFNGSVVVFLCALWFCCGFVIFFRVGVVFLWFVWIWFCGLCPCGVVGCVFVFVVCVLSCLCVMDCGGPVWADL